MKGGGGKNGHGFLRFLLFLRIFANCVTANMPMGLFKVELLILLSNGVGRKVHHATVFPIGNSPNSFMINCSPFINVCVRVMTMQLYDIFGQ